MIISTKTYDFYGNQIEKVYSLDTRSHKADSFQIDINLTVNKVKENISSMVYNGTDFIPPEVKFPQQELILQIKENNTESIEEIPNLSNTPSEFDLINLFGIYLGSTRYFRERNYWEREINKYYFYYPSNDEIRVYTKDRDTDFHYNSKNDITYTNEFFNFDEFKLPLEILSRLEKQLKKG